MKKKVHIIVPNLDVKVTILWNTFLGMRMNVFNDRDTSFQKKKKNDTDAFIKVK